MTPEQGAWDLCYFMVFCLLTVIQINYLLWAHWYQEMAEIFLNAMPVKLENDEIVLKETLIFEVPGFDEYSENLIKSSTIKVWKIASGKESIAETREIPYNNAVWSVHLERIYP